MKELSITVCSKLTDWLFGTLTSMGIFTAVEASKQFHLVSDDFWNVIYKTNELLGRNLDIIWWINLSIVIIGLAYSWWLRRHPPKPTLDKP